MTSSSVWFRHERKVMGSILVTTELSFPEMLLHIGRERAEHWKKIDCCQATLGNDNSEISIVLR